LLILTGEVVFTDRSTDAVEGVERLATDDRFALGLHDQRQQMPAEHQESGEADDHQRNVVQLARPVGTSVKQNANGKHKRARGEPCNRLNETHCRL